MGPNVESLAVEAWYMDSSDDDQRLSHRQNPNRPVSTQQLRDIGVLNWVLNADIYENDPELEQIRKDRGYSYQDIIEVSRDTLPNYDQKLKNFYEEHLHTDEEIRYCVEGSGYFDVRDFDDQWIRVAVRKGGMIVLPAGMYHRFTLDSNNYIKAVRLFVGEPVWTPYNRPQEDLPIRKEYLSYISTKKNVLPWEKASVPLAV